MGAMYGTERIPVLRYYQGGVLSNGMYGVWTKPYVDEFNKVRIDVDVYRDNRRSELVSMQHGIAYAGDLDERMVYVSMMNMLGSMADQF